VSKKERERKKRENPTAKDLLLVVTHIRPSSQHKWRRNKLLPAFLPIRYPPKNKHTATIHLPFPPSLPKSKKMSLPLLPVRGLNWTRKIGVPNDLGMVDGFSPSLFLFSSTQNEEISPGKSKQEK
jgi:hypothetical protein